MIYIFIFVLSLISHVYSSSIDLITTNDLHGFIAEQDASFMNPMHPPKIIGGSGLYRYIEENVERENSLILDAGNFFQGHPMSVVDSGKTMIEFMNKVQYSALVPGPDDFIYGAKNLDRLASLANFPFLFSNLECNNCNLDSTNFKPYLVKEINGIKFGFLGIVDSDLSNKLPSDKIEGINVKSGRESIEKWLPILDSISDVKIILTSSGVPYDREEVYNDFISDLKSKKEVSDSNYSAVELGYFSKGIDLVVAGGVSKGYDVPWVDPNNGVIVMQNYGNGTSFGHLLLNIENNKFKNFDFVIKGKQSQTLLLDDFKPDESIRDWINDKYQYALELLYSPLLTQEVFKSDIEVALPELEMVDAWSFPELGSDEKLDIVTWNCEFFPTANQQTIDALSEAVHDLNVDIIAFQEIKQIGWFDRMMELLPNYEYVISDNSSFMHQAFIYKRDQFKFIRKTEPFAENDYNFAGRPPLRLDLYRFSDSKYYSLINIHMKCCNSGLQRRKNAVSMIYDYVSSEIENSNKNFVVLGDWNDDLKDKDGEHCFEPFMNDSRFEFCTNRIINDISQSTYPKEPYVSFLDHILVNKRMVENGYDIKTIMMGEYMGGFEQYELLISDHLPVLLSF